MFHSFIGELFPYMGTTPRWGYVVTYCVGTAEGGYSDAANTPVRCIEGDFGPRNSPRTSPRSSPRNSPRNGPQISPQRMRGWVHSDPVHV